MFKALYRKLLVGFPQISKAIVLLLDQNVIYKVIHCFFSKLRDYGLLFIQKVIG